MKYNIIFILLLIVGCTSTTTKNEDNPKKVIHIKNVTCYKGKIFIQIDTDRYYSMFIDKNGNFVPCKGKVGIKDIEGYQASSDLEK